MFCLPQGELRVPPSGGELIVFITFSVVPVYSLSHVFFINFSHNWGKRRRTSKDVDGTEWICAEPYAIIVA